MDMRVKRGMVTITTPIMMMSMRKKMKCVVSKELIHPVDSITAITNTSMEGKYNQGNQFPQLYFPQPNRRSVASHFQPREHDDASPILFPAGNEHQVVIRPNLINIVPMNMRY